MGYTAREESHEVLVYLKIRLCLESAYSFSHTPPAKIKVKLKGTKSQHTNVEYSAKPLCDIHVALLSGMLGHILYPGSTAVL